MHSEIEKLATQFFQSIRVQLGSALISSVWREHVLLQLDHAESWCGQTGQPITVISANAVAMTLKPVAKLILYLPWKGWQEFR